MNILHVIPGLTVERGGPSTCVEALTRHQARAGHAVHVLVTDQGQRHGERPVELAPGVALHRARVVGPDRLAYAPRFASLCRALLRECDVVHVHSLFTHPVHVALREALAQDVPLVLKACGHLHRYSLGRSAGPKRVYLRLWGGRALRACSAWHFTSAREAEESWPWRPRPHFVLPNGIDPEEFAADRRTARSAAELAWPALAGAPYVLFLGRLHPKKRLDLLLDAFLRGVPEPSKLVVAGPDEGGLWPGLANRFLGDPAAARRVVRLGTVRGRDKINLLAGARLFALPSEHENFGSAALEALAAGTPLLLSPHVDLSGDAVPAGWGRHAALDDAQWGRALADLLAEPDDPQRGDRLSAWVADHFSWHRLSDQLLGHYREIGARGRGTENDRSLTPAP